MNPTIKYILAIMVFAVVIPPVSSIHVSLERKFHTNHSDHSVQLNEIVAADRERHARLFNKDSVQFPPLQGSISGTKIYTTKVKLGTPPKEITLQVDTGSSDFWVTCSSCGPNCTRSPRTDGDYDPQKSSTASVVQCSNVSEYCDYKVEYDDESISYGYIVQDNLHFDIQLNGTTVQNSSAPILFGCSTGQTGDLTSGRPMDGILGLGPRPQLDNLHQPASAILQLSSKGVTRPVFSHCLRGDGSGGGSLIFGEVKVPGMVYSPLVPSQDWYMIDLKGIKVNGENLQINPLIFASNTYIDSGTTLAYFPKVAFDAMSSQIKAAVHSQPAVTPITRTFDDGPCYIVHNRSVNNIFPTISLDFVGDSSMVLKPSQYLVNMNEKKDGGELWCFSFQISLTNETILGDVVLSDKIVTYDILDKKTIGWGEYNCSNFINVSSSIRNAPTFFIVLLLCTNLKKHLII